jgi:alanine-glyoxylate transaminase/serine-glyoxylate transaminase/serine-pyruvate transaminase
LETLGISFIVNEQDRLPQLNAVTIPRGVDDGQVRNRLLHDYDLEIGAGLGNLAGSVWRIGLMGHASNQANVDKCLQALKDVL